MTKYKTQEKEDCIKSCCSSKKDDTCIDRKTICEKPKECCKKRGTSNGR